MLYFVSLFLFLFFLFVFFLESGPSLQRYFINNFGNLPKQYIQYPMEHPPSKWVKEKINKLSELRHVPWYCLTLQYEREKLENELMITKVSLTKWPMDEENISPALRALMVAFESPSNWHMKANSDCNKDSLMNDTLNSHFYWIAIGGWFPWRINGGLVPSKNY